MTFAELKYDCACAQKRGIHFIIASILVWACIAAICLTNLDIHAKNLGIFCSTAILMPVAYFVSRLMKIDFTHKNNPLTKVGILFSVNQLLYILIAMWAYNAAPYKMAMIMAIIFGAHLMPFSWLYDSKIYLIFSIFIPIMALILGCIFQLYVLPLAMVAVEILFAILLHIENKNLGKQTNGRQKT